MADFGMKMKLNLKQQQKLAITQTMNLSLKMLQYQRLEMQEFIQENLEKNPVLELEDENAVTTILNPPGDDIADESTKSEVVNEEGGFDTSDWDDHDVSDQYIDPYIKPKLNSERYEKNEINYENFIPYTPSLLEHLLKQLKVSTFSSDEYKIGEILIGYINGKGYFYGDIAKIAENLGVDEETVESVLYTIQTFDPTGIGARNLRECLLMQIEEKEDVNFVAVDIIDEYLDEIADKRYAFVAERLEISEQEVLDAISEIQKLDPNPAASFAYLDDIYIVPDVFVEKIDDNYVVKLNNEGIPSLRVNKYYMKLRKQLRRLKRQKIQETASEYKYLTEKMNHARWLISSIEKRGTTIRKVTEAIVKEQKDFLDKGVKFLKPLILEDIAKMVDLNQSTVGRATTGKYVQTPRGVFELKYFFSNKLPSTSGISTRSIREYIKEIIEKEDRCKPFGDEKIVERLKNEYSVTISRRAVTKYRKIMDIPNSSKRKIKIK